MTTQIEQDAYQAAQETAVFVDRSNLALFKITGESRLEILDRISTQAVTGLESREGTATVLTTDIGRVIDRLLLYAGSDALYVLAGEGHRAPLAQYLMRNVFFNDDFHLEDLTEETAVFAVYGPQAGKKLAAAGFPETDLPLHHWRQAEIGGQTAYLHRTDPVAGDGYFVMVDAAGRDALYDHLAESGVTPIDDATFDLLRIESGLPRFGRELTLDYIPLEANLWDDVSFNKGCYTGQEIIARMESRGRLAKRLVRLRPEAPVAAGTEVRAGGRKAGTVTSAATGPAGPAALAYLKTAVLDDDDADLTVGETAVRVLSADA
jgi:aminomethyltransferase